VKVAKVTKQSVGGAIFVSVADDTGSVRRAHQQNAKSYLCEETNMTLSGLTAGSH